MCRYYPPWSARATAERERQTDKQGGRKIDREREIWGRRPHDTPPNYLHYRLYSVHTQYIQIKHLVYGTISPRSSGPQSCTLPMDVCMYIYSTYLVTGIDPRRIKGLTEGISRQLCWTKGTRTSFVCIYIEGIHPLESRKRMTTLDRETEPQSISTRRGPAQTHKQLDTMCPSIKAFGGLPEYLRMYFSSNQYIRARHSTKLTLWRRHITRGWGWDGWRMADGG